MNNEEKERQEQFPWERSKYHATYNSILAHYKVLSCLEHSVGSALLDLACGDGMMTEQFSKHFEKVVGVDASGKHIAEAKKRCPTVTFYESLIEDLQIKEKFDSIFLLDILEHVLDPCLLLQKAASFLNPGGVMIVHVPNAEAINRRIAVIMGTLKTCDELSPFDVNVAGHRRSYTLNTLQEEIKKAGLVVNSTGGVFYKMLSTAQMDWFLENGLWADGGFGWGRSDGPKLNWRTEFCRACYEIGKAQPADCNIIYAIITKE